MAKPTLARSRLMARIRSRDTAPERAFRRAIWRRGIRFRVCDGRLPGRPDLVLPARRLVVFIDGDFWHGHQWRLRRLTSVDQQFLAAANREYWQAKIRRNVERDLRSTAQLLDEGWTVLRFWESDLARRLDECVDLTISAIEGKAPPAPESIVAARGAAEFFAGIGLVRLALEARGWSVRFANDHDPKKIEMYASNFGAADLSDADINELGAKDVPDCGLYTASFPCNDLSVAGAQAGLAGKQSGAFWQLIRILEEKGDRRPPLVLLENVVGFLTSHQGADFAAALGALAELGYVVDAFMLSAVHFTPQSRPRLFIVAKKQQTRGGEVAESTVRPAALVEFIRNHPELPWDIRTLPEPPEPESRLDDILEELPSDDPAWWSEDRAAYFMNQLSDRHRQVADRMIAGRRVSHATAFRRVRKGRSMAELRTDGVAGCLRTPRGGSGRQILFRAGRGQYAVRLLTARECARLQGAPDRFRIETPLNQALFGFGDAVCAPAIEWIVEHYLTPVASELIRGRVLRL